MHADPDAFAAEVAALCGPAEADALRRYLADLAELYRLQLGTFIDRNLDSPLDLLGPELVTLARRGGFGRLSRHVERYFADDRLRRLFSFQALYAGVSPFRAIAAYAVIAQLDIGAGVWHPVGGIAASPAPWPPPRPRRGSTSGTAPPWRARTSGRRVVGVRLVDGERLPADAVVVTTDQPHTLVPGLRPPRRPVYSPSCVALHLGVRAELPGQAHHTISFGTRGRGARGAHPRRAPMSDPACWSACRRAPTAAWRRRAGAEHRRPRRTSTGAAAATRPRLGGARPSLPRRGAGALEARGWTG